jgi:hypothetical protein
MKSRRSGSKCRFARASDGRLFLGVADQLSLDETERRQVHFFETLPDMTKLTI